MYTTLDFEKPIVELEQKITELQHLSHSGDVNIQSEVQKLREKVHKLLTKTYNNLSSWQKVQVARHPDRPHTSEFIEGLCTDFVELAGDRNFADDKAIIGGLARFSGIGVVVLGHEKGKDTESRLKHNFGMPKPEGYRKSQRLMNLANQFHLPVLTFVDTSGAHPGLEAEERGQAEAIARSIETTLNLQVPVISIITGEGMSGGAIAIAAANRVVMLEHAIYTVIAPEGCASILWRTIDKKQEAAETQRLTAQEIFKLKVIDEIIQEPLGGAHRDKKQTIEATGKMIEKHLNELLRLDGPALREQRFEKFLAMGRNL